MNQRRHRRRDGLGLRQMTWTEKDDRQRHRLGLLPLHVEKAIKNARRAAITKETADAT